MKKIFENVFTLEKIFFPSWSIFIFEHEKGIIIARGITGIGEKMDHPRSGREKIHGGWIKSDEPRFGVIYGQSSSISNFNPNRNWDIFRKQKGREPRTSLCLGLI